MLWLLIPPAVQADTLPTGTLHKETVVYVDMRAGEVINFYLRSVPVCTDEDGTVLSDPYILTGAFTVSEDTLLRCELTGDEEAPTGSDQPWFFKVIDISERGFPEPSGRVFSYEWVITADDEDLSHTFYVPVPVDTTDDPLGEDSSSRVMKLEASGLRGEGLRVSANTAGIPDHHVLSDYYADELPGRLPVYLSAPEEARTATWPSAPTTDWSLKYTYETDGCEGIIPGQAPAVMRTSAAPVGMLGIICDIDGDGEWDHSSADGDVLGGLAASPGEAEWVWDGAHADGDGFVEAGSYRCAALLQVGGVHALVDNADVADPGIRLFERVGTDAASGVSLFWNDRLLRDDVPLASGAVAPLHSGPEVRSGDPSSPAEAPDNAHGWGNLSESLSRGSIGWIDTWTPGAVYDLGGEEVVILDPDSDEDSDGLPLGEECALGTRPSDDDSDGDGVSDGQEVEDGTDPLDPIDFLADAEDSGDPDLVEDDTAVDTISPPGDTGGGSAAMTWGLGDYSGGAFRCASVPATAGGGLWLVLLGLIGGARRSPRPGDGAPRRRPPPARRAPPLARRR